MSAPTLADQAAACWRAALVYSDRGAKEAAADLDAAGYTVAAAQGREFALEDAARLLLRLVGPVEDAATMDVLCEDAAAWLARHGRDSQ